MEAAPVPRRMTRGRRRQAALQRCRCRWAISLAIGALVTLMAVMVSAAGHEGLLGLLWVAEDFLDTSRVNTALTTAEVDTAPPGSVRLPMVTSAWSEVPSPLVALRPGRTQLVLAFARAGAPQATELAGYVSDDRRLVRHAPWDKSSVGNVRALAWTGDGDYLAVATDTGLQVYGTDPNGALRQLTTVGLTGARAVAGAPGRDLWILVGSEVRHLKWNMRQYREEPARRITGLADPRGISSSPRDGVLLVLDGERVRYYRTSPDGSLREETAHGLTVAGAQSVAAVGQGGYRVLVADPQGQAAKTVHVQVSGAGARVVPAHDDSLPEPAWAIAPSPWGDMDYVSLSAWGLRYRAAAGRNVWRSDGARSAAGNWWQEMVRRQVAYEPDAVLVSQVVRTQIPIGRIRLTAVSQVPEGTAVGFDVSTDGGTTWTTVPLDTNVEVPPGFDFAYRIRLHTDHPLDLLKTPVVDRVEVRQVVVTNGPAAALNLRVRARLTR